MRRERKEWKLRHWQDPIWQRRERLATEERIASAKEDVLTALRELADDLTVSLPSQAWIREQIDAVVAEIEPVKVRRVVSQDVAHCLLNVYRCDVWAAYAREVVKKG